MGLGGSNPHFMLFQSHALLMPLSGSRTVGPKPSLIPRSEAGYMHPCILSLAPSPISLMQTAAIATDTLHSLFQLITHPHNPAFMSPISSSSTGLYFLSSFIISLVSPGMFAKGTCPSILLTLC